MTTLSIQVDVWNTMEMMDMNHYQKNSEFEVVNSSVRKFITYYDCCLEPYPDIKVSSSKIIVKSG